MKIRTLASILIQSTKTFPAIVLTGPRQSGKTTLLKNLFGKKFNYVSLENPDIRLRAREDPLSFLKQFEGPVIIDEIQYVSELLPYIKTLIDEDRSPGKWILTGSQNFVLMQGVTESLAGRAAILTLLPFSLSEITDNGNKSLSVEHFLNNIGHKLKLTPKLEIAERILRGSYPEISSNNKIDRQIWCGSYITTYLERDIRNLKQVGDLRQFEIFLKTCAIRTGQILDLSSLAREIGVSFTTVKSWISLLQTGYQIYLLYPYYRNIGKRLVKRPKIYFADTALATYLMGINSKDSLVSSPMFGALFETLVVIDFIKRYAHHGEMESIYYLRTQDDAEIDIIIESEGNLNLIEIKSTSTLKKEHLTSLFKLKSTLGNKIKKTAVVSNTKDSFVLGGDVTNIPIESLVN